MTKHQTDFTYPGNPRTATTSDGGSSTGPHSDITDHYSETNSVEDENFIALLQYRDAYHILNLSPPQSPPSAIHPDHLSPEIVQDAYDVAKEQALVALEQFEASQQNQSNNGPRNMFFTSQKNYLELKLQALDQAYAELMPDEMIGAAADDGADGEMGSVDDADDTPEPKKSLQAELAPPSPQTSSSSSKRDANSGGSKVSPGNGSPQGGGGNEASTNAALRNEQDQNKPSSPRRYRLDDGGPPSDDELDTIDIYFRPAPSKKPASPERQKRASKSPVDHPSDMSSCTWDGSSIFSMISQTKKILDDASEGGLSDVLGPKAIGSDNLNTAPPPMAIGGKGGQKSSRGAAVSETKNLNKESRNNQSNQQSLTSQKPPSGINVKHKLGRPTSPRAQISPRSVTDFPGGIHNDGNHYDSTSGFNTRRGKLSVIGKGKMMKGSRAASSRYNQHTLAHDATEAARMGILRALSEDNSECYPLDNDEPTYALNISHDISNMTPGLSTNAMIEGRSPRGVIGGKSPGGLPKSKRYFQGKTDRLPKESNSLLASVMNDDGTRQTYDESTIRSTTSSLTEGRRDDKGDTAPPATFSRSPPTPSRKQQQQQEQQQRGEKTKSRHNSYSKQSSSSPTNGSNSTSDESTKDGNDYRPDDLLQPSIDSYDAFLQTGMELADELCMALNSCFKGGDTSEFVKTLSQAGSAASAAFDTVTSDMDRSSAQLDSASPCGTSQTFSGHRSHLEEESTAFTRSTYNEEEEEEDESTAYNTYTTDGESTAFNTMSSFSHGRSSPNSFARNRKMTMKPISPNTVSTGSSDPPPRMLV